MANRYVSWPVKSADAVVSGSPSNPEQSATMSGRDCTRKRKKGGGGEEKIRSWPKTRELNMCGREMCAYMYGV